MVGKSKKHQALTKTRKLLISMKYETNIEPQTEKRAQTKLKQEGRTDTATRDETKGETGKKIDDRLTLVVVRTDGRADGRNHEARQTSTRTDKLRTRRVSQSESQAGRQWSESTFYCQHDHHDMVVVPEG